MEIRTFSQRERGECLAAKVAEEQKVIIDGLSRQLRHQERIPIGSRANTTTHELRDSVIEGYEGLRPTCPTRQFQNMKKKYTGE